MIFTENGSIVIQESLNPELKEKWNSYKNSDVEDCKKHFSTVKSIYNSCQSIADYKYARKLLSNFYSAWANEKDADQSCIKSVNDLIGKCDAKIRQMKDDKINMK